MKCLINFCSDNYQNRLRLLAQARSERYEETLDIYKEIFIAHYRHIIEKCCLNTCINKYPCDKIYEKLKQIEESEIISFFDGIKNVYIKWIDADCIHSIKTFEKLLKKYHILDNGILYDISNIYFKGRITKDILTRFDMFHIPFNKRYLINNQRYSLTGQPLIYIGSSILDIVMELNAMDKIEDLKVSSVQLPKNIRLYDLRINIYEELNKLQTDFMLGDEKNSFDKIFLFRLILSSVCSFQKRQELRNFSFCEEYVIPQILAQIIKNNKYQGIIYYSTKKYDNIKVENNILEYKENIALFTKNTNAHIYDQNLYKNLQISVPISLEKIEKIDANDINEIKEKIDKLKEQEKITQAEKIISSFDRTYRKLVVDNKEYIETSQGQLHMYHLFAVLNQILK